MKIFICSLCLMLSFYWGNAQKISGVIKNESGQLISYASITVKGTTKGVSANNIAAFSIALPAGKHVLVCQHIGYATQEKLLEIVGDTTVDFILQEQRLMLKAVVVTNTGENPAYAIIRQAIKKRSFYNNQVKKFRCDVYSKDVIKLRSLPEKIMGKKLESEDRKSMGVDSSGNGIIYLSEAMSSISRQLPNDFKMTVKSSRVSGSNGFGFTFPTFINMYDNNVDIFNGGSIAARGFVSPIAEGALNYYKYKMLGSYQENGKVINTIKVTPKRKYEPLFSGIINIVDDDWRIHSYDLTATKESQLQVVDTVKITQLFVPVESDVWTIKNQLIYFSVKIFGIDAVGNFLTVYSNYELDPPFDKKYFNKVMIKYDSGVDKKSKTFWDTVRPVPLGIEEVRDYSYKDSLLKVELDSASVRNNIDSLKKRQGKLKLLSFVYGGVNRRHFSKQHPFNWGVRSILSSFQYNTAEGISLELSGYVDKKINDRINMRLQPYFRYGFSNTHVNSWLDMMIRVGKPKDENTSTSTRLKISGGKTIAQYNDENPIAPIVNSFSTLMNGKNEMKIYEKIFTSISIAKRHENGLKVSFKMAYEDRLPIYNTSTYTFDKKDSSRITENLPVCKNVTLPFERHQAALLDVTMSFKPGQRFIEFPNRKVAIGSKYPTFLIQYTKGVQGLLGSDVNFDKWKLEVFDDMQLKLLGAMKYRFTVGGFLQTNRVYFQDYVHFNSNSTRAISSYLNGFQLMNSYINSNAAALSYEGHVEHHLNGLLTNKIPYFKKLNWHLVTGGNGYLISNKDYYTEYFIGLENILKIFRVDFVVAHQNGAYVNSSFVLGAGGLLGSGLSDAGNSRSVSIGF